MKAHRTDVVSLGFGLFFVALAAWWLFAQLLGLALPPIGWFLAGGLLLIGVLGLVGALRSGRVDRTAAPHAATTGATATEAGAQPAEEPGADLTATEAGGERADEWPIAAVSDSLPEAVEDRPVSGGQAPRWSPTDPLDEDLATRKFGTGAARERDTEPLPRLAADATAPYPPVESDAPPQPGPERTAG
ncbi:hypothetical protein MCAG_01976 [Micromonospora sp. ATCC 39149]|nr:hypothetical protein MCAG_01976 [Micromonospora sp. ATCC 39149]